MHLTTAQGSYKMHPFLSWSIVLAVCGAIGYYYRNNGKVRGGRARTGSRASDLSIRDEKKIRKNSKAKEVVNTALEKASDLSAAVVDTTADLTSGKKRKNNKQAKPAPAPQKKEAPAPAPVVEEEKDDVKAFAQQFANVRKGTDLKPASANENSKKQRRAKKQTANATSAAESSGNSTSAHISTASSTNGQDADDDLSPATSPSFTATQPAGDISDMLEAPAPAASVLRLTGDLQGKQKKKAPVADFQTVSNSKKKRAQERKKEERKEMVQAAELERKKLLERQMHIARSSERAAAATKTSAPAKNAWAPTATPTQTTPKATENVPFLDTFTPTTETKSTPSATTKDWIQSLPSEEEQMKILAGNTGDDDWTTVSKRKEKKKEAPSVSDSSEISEPVEKPKPKPVIAPKPKTAKPTNGFELFASEDNGIKGHALDSDWVA